MEDTHVVIDEVDASFSNEKQVAFYGCFDGHGGTETAKMIEEILHTTVFRRQEFIDGNYVEALEKAFEEADKIVVSHSLENNYMNGCTAVVGVVVDGILHIANVGDAEGILVSVSDDGTVTAENLTFAHKASVPSEKARIEALGGYVFFNRVFGSLAVSRAFGDSKYKQPKTTQNYVSYAPSTKSIELTTQHRYLLLACDGLWDVCSHDEVAKLIHEHSESGKNPEEIASFLCTEAIRKRSEDNVTVILTKIEWSTSLRSSSTITNNAETKKSDTEMLVEQPNSDITKNENASEENKITPNESTNESQENQVSENSAQTENI